MRATPNKACGPVARWERPQPVHNASSRAELKTMGIATNILL
jgi:hypothetical protein